MGSSESIQPKYNVCGFFEKDGNFKKWQKDVMVHDGKIIYIKEINDNNTIGKEMKINYNTIEIKYFQIRNKLYHSKTLYYSLNSFDDLCNNFDQVSLDWF
jgi:hypothetical protein